MKTRSTYNSWRVSYPCTTHAANSVFLVVFCRSRGKRSTYFIDPVIEGRAGLRFSSASIRYFVGLYENLVTPGREGESTRDKKRNKHELGVDATQQCLPVVKPDGCNAEEDLPWKADGEFKVCSPVWSFVSTC